MSVPRILSVTRAPLAGAVLGATLIASALTGLSPAYADHHHRAQKVDAPDAQTSVKAQDVIDLALKQVGISENSRGGGTKFHEWYMSSERAKETLRRDGGSVAGYRNAPWCAMFVSWVGDKLGARPTVGWDAYTVTHAEWFRDNNRWGGKPKRGAVVFFSWSGGKSIDSINHVGFVMKDNGDGTIKTVEGNTGSGQVQVRTRPKSQVVGYGYPEYATA
ncbi:CHAP domain-containing protein [Streptosporangium sp. KLBMP 9127]|nr:CHAP domain-containing protein [Streptosporangium sp. KLBMP 9127]